MVPDALIEPGPGQDRYIFVVEKATQRLFIYEFKMGRYFLRRSFPVTTGENRGDKQKEGDQRTPEGLYLFVDKFIERELAPIYGILAFPLDYPNFWDKRLGKDGNGIWMHGSNRELVPHDSNGCVAMRNIDLLEVDGIVRLDDTPIIIYDKVRYKSVGEIDREASRVKAFVDNWRAAWANKDLEAYLSCYDRDFKSADGMDMRTWRVHKDRLNRKYRNIRVDVSQLRVFRHQGLVVALFKQDYQGDSYKSPGIKRLYLRERENGYRIAAEICRAVPSPKPSKLLPLAVRNRVIEEARLARFEKSDKDALLQAEEVQVSRAVDKWLKDWRDQNLDEYLSHYHPDFSYKNMGLPKFRDYKAGLFRKYDKIVVKVQNLDIKLNGNQAQVAFTQDFRSDRYQDFGLKKLVLVKYQGQWRIKNESWDEIRAGAKP